jgi:hypothetical protein
MMVHYCDSLVQLPYVLSWVEVPVVAVARMSLVGDLK